MTPDSITRTITWHAGGAIPLPDGTPRPWPFGQYSPASGDYLFVIGTARATRTTYIYAEEWPRVICYCKKANLEPPDFAKGAVRGLSEAMERLQWKANRDREVSARCGDWPDCRGLISRAESIETVIAELTRLREVERQFEAMKRHERERLENAARVLGVKTGDQRIAEIVTKGADGG